MKIIDASEPELGSSMTEQEAENFLSSGQLFARIGSIDNKGYPNVHPVWYYFDNDKIYFETGREAKKVKNISNNDKVYFCIDDNTPPYKGVRGKGIASLVTNTNKSLPITKKILIKYTGDLENKMAKFLLNSVKTGEAVVVEINPNYFATWDHSKGDMQ